MRALLLLALAAAAMLPLRAAEPWESAYAALLQKYATPAGVRYEAWHAAPADRQALRELVETIATKGPTDTSREGRLAYLINAYNIAMLGQVLDAYPIKSVKDLAPNFGVFSGERITVAGKKTSLNELEKRALLDEFREPRIHFAINCASRSCPPLRGEPFTAAKIEEQLDSATQQFLTANPLGVAIDGGAARISSIFDWYAEDFASVGGAPTFIQRYRPLPPATKIAFQTYDWTLNAAR